VEGDLSRMLSRWLKRVKAVIRNPHFWVILVLLVSCTIHHYHDQIGFVTILCPDLLFGLTRHTVDRIFYLVPIIYASYIFSPAGGLATTFVALLLMLPRALFFSPSPSDALSETGVVILVAVLVNLWLRARAKQRMEENLRFYVQQVTKAQEEERLRIARELRATQRMEENLRFYVQQVTKAQEEERLRIARDLHDSTAQSLIALLHQLENLLYSKAKLPVGEARELWVLHERIKDILQEVRHLGRDLRPSILDDVGLLAALRWAVREFKTEHSVAANLRVQGDERRFSQEVELMLFRIVQEALSNIGRHSQASKAEVLIRFEEGKTAVIIKDDGIGFQPPDKIGDLSRSGKLGLVGMQERVRLLGGSLEVKSEPGKGTTVIVEAPI